MKKELLFIFFVFLVYYGLHGFPTDVESFSGDTSLNLNFHDTYFVIDSKLYLTFTLLFTFSISYLIRILVTQFESRFASYIYLITNALFIICLLFSIRFFNTMLRDLQEVKATINDVFYYFFYFTSSIFIFSVMLEIYVLFKVRKRN